MTADVVKVGHLPEPTEHDMLLAEAGDRERAEWVYDYHYRRGQIELAEYWRLVCAIQGSTPHRISVALSSSLQASTRTAVDRWLRALPKGHETQEELLDIYYAKVSLASSDFEVVNHMSHAAYLSPRRKVRMLLRACQHLALDMCVAAWGKVALRFWNLDTNQRNRVLALVAAAERGLSRDDSVILQNADAALEKLGETNPLSDIPIEVVGALIAGADKTARSIGKHGELPRLQL